MGLGPQNDGHSSNANADDGAEQEELRAHGGAGCLDGVAGDAREVRWTAAFFLVLKSGIKNKVPR